MAYPATIQSAETSEGDINAELAQVERIEQPKYLQQTIPYAAAITPDPTLGEVVTIGTLTGAITINNPVNGLQSGRKLRFLWTQDGTGGRVITWGNAFLAGAAAATTLSKSFSQSFTYNGTNWVADGAPFLLN